MLLLLLLLMMMMMMMCVLISRAALILISDCCNLPGFMRRFIRLMAADQSLIHRACALPENESALAHAH